MGDLKITGLIGENEIQTVKELDATLERVKTTYVEAAKELAKGLKINVEVVGDLDKLNSLVLTQTKKAQEATDLLTESVKKRNDVVEKTTATISRELAAIEKESARKAEAYQADKRALDIAKDILGSRGQNLERLVKLETELTAVSNAQKRLNDEEKRGNISAGELLKKRQSLVEQERTLKTAKSELNNILSREEKLSQATVGSYDEMSHSLEMMKRAYKQMSIAEKTGSNGQILASEIQKADKRLKELSADMGEFHRNVGNYTSSLDSEYAPAIKNALGLNNSFADSLLQLSEKGEDSGGFFDNLSIKSKAFGNTLLTLLKNPVFLSIAGITAAGMAFKFWYDYNKGLVEASRLTTQFTGLHGDEMKQYRNEVQAVADIFEVDFKETLIATNAVAKQFGIEQSDALKLIKDGFIAGANANGEFLDNLKEYPAYFKEAGLSASQFIAITTQANQAGIYSDKGIDVIKEGNLRIREMTNATATALDGIGISSKKVLEDLRKGNVTTFDVMKKVSEKLNELPESSSAVGTAIADIFGGPGEDAGLQYIRTLKDIDTELDNVKRRTGEFADVQDDLLSSQVELSNALASMFDSTGGGFETLTAKAKIFMNDVLKDLLVYLNNITSSYESLGIQRLNNAEQQGKDAAKADKEWQDSTIAGIKIVAEKYKKQGLDENAAFKKAKDEKLAIMKRSLSIEEEEMSSYVEQNRKYNKELENGNFWRQSIGLDRTNSQINKDINETFDLIEFRTASLASQKEKIDFVSLFEPNTEVSAKKTADERKREEEARKKASEEAKIILEIRRNLEESNIEQMDDGLEKELAKIKLGYRKRIDAITGNSNAEKAIRANLEKQKLKELSEYRQGYEIQFQKTNLENKLRIVKEGTEEELTLKKELLKIQEDAEIKSAEKVGADVSLIKAKYQRERQELDEKYSSRQILLIADNTAAEQVLRDQQYKIDMIALKKALSEKKITEKEYSEEEYRLALDYARKTTEAAIDALEMELKADNISAGDRAKIAEQLQKLKADLAQKEAEAEIDAIEKVNKADEKARKKRIKNVQQWLQIASQAISAISDLVATVYDGKIDKIEQEQEANDEAYDRDVERTTTLVEQKIITEEEGEARKRAAQVKTEEKHEELENKKAALAYKQAVWEKATSAAQIGISTAEAIMTTIANLGWPLAIPFVVATGIIGAVQLATVLSTPIPSYAEGTKEKNGHPGGKALVGDAGKREVVMFAGQAWVTPDTPTLVDLPRGAQVFPDVDVMNFSDFDYPAFSISGSGATDRPTPIIINNDYSKLERGISQTNYLLRVSINQQHRDAYNREYQSYKRNRL